MYTLLRSSHPATGVEHSLSCYFFNSSERNLVVAGANVLKVFRLVPDVDTKTETSDNNEDGNTNRLKMECLASWEMFGWVQSMASARLTGSDRDTLLLTFKDAKMSLVEYNPETHDLQTLSLHHFEEDSMKDGFIHNEWVPSVRVDPDNRCAAMLAYGKKIMILPFRREVSGNLNTSGNDQDTSNLSLEGLALGGRVMPSYTLDLATVIQTHTVDNIIDIQFLHGYNQPTLLILYEPLKTYAGRIAVRKDTCRLDVISLDVKEKISAFIWSREVLPFDCTRAVPVPMPIGGTLVFAVNSLFYLNQGIPLYGVSLNCTGDKDVTTNILLKKQEGVKISLDCAVADFLSPEQIVISLKGGELYVLSLLVDSLRSVKGFHLDKAAASVLTTSLCLPTPNYLFLGSRLGNSLLLRVSSREGGQIGAVRRQEREPPNKKMRVDMAGDWLDAELEMDDTELFGTQETAQYNLKSFSFEVCDSLMNIGPCGQVAMGEPAFLSEAFNSSIPDPDIELVTTAGHGKNGALCLLQRSIRPQVLTTFQIPGTVDMWTVFSGQGKLEHAYLILSTLESTMILQTGEEINELDSSGFFTSGPTVYAGNVGNNQFIIQVTKDNVLLLKDSDLVQTLELELDNDHVVTAVSCDPYLAVVTAAGQAVIISLTAGKLSIIKAKIGELPGRAKSPFQAVSLYKDMSGLLTNENRLLGGKERKGKQASSKKEDLDDEDELLYGSSDFTVGMFGVSGAAGAHDKSMEEEESWRKYLEVVTPTFWMIGVRENGNLELYSIPDFTMRFVSHNFPQQPDVLKDNVSVRQTGEQQHHQHGPGVTEILMVGLGTASRRPVLLARTKDQEIVMYEVYPFYGKDLSQDQLKIRFKKLNHGLILRERKKKREIPASAIRKSTIRHFSDIAGYEGVFVSGPYPHWLFLTGRGELRCHPMLIDGSVSTFSPFHNVNCPQGFLYFNRKCELRICVLPGHLSYDAPWPVRKVPLRCTPHHITFHIESKTFAVVTSVSEQTNKIWKFNGDDKELSIEDRSDRFIYPSLLKFSLQLFSPSTWEPIPNTKLQLDDWEYATCCKHLYLSSEGMHSGQRGFIVMGSNFNYGEDITSRGNIKIFDIIEVVPEPGQPLTKNKIKTVYDKEQKGPITAISAVSGFLVTTVGQKIYIWQFKDKDLHGIAFIDSQIYIHQIHSLKNFLLVGDVYKSINVLQYQQDYRTLSLISRDTAPLETYACEFTIDNGHLGFVASDSMRNLSVFMYSPESREAMGGHRLMRKADIHIGQHINWMWRVKAKLSDPTTAQRLLAANEKKHVTWYATLDGSLGHLLPVAEKTYRRLLMLMNVMTTNLPHTAGLNPKGFRTLRQKWKDLRNPSRGVVDGDLVFKYSNLSVTLKAELARKIGTTTEEIMEDLAELDRSAAHF